MMLRWSRPLCLINARVVTPDGEAPSIRFRRRILSVGDRPQPGDQVVDLEGRYVLPGLVNAHDHLELNHYGLLKCRERYDNAGEWIDDLRPVIKSDPRIRTLSRYPLGDRLFIGGLKNLLAGVTFVAHHNPMYRDIGARFPVRVLRRFGWAHSVGLQDGPVGAGGERGGMVRDRVAATPADRPFIVHAAEGVDGRAAGEIGVLDRAGAIRPNTVIVHGVAVPPSQWPSLFGRGVGLVWCPASNLFLFGRTICVRRVMSLPAAAARICLGSDSRLTGARDLLDELRVAQSEGVDGDTLLRMVTSAPADLLHVADAGRLIVGRPADLLVIPAGGPSAGESLLRCSRRDLALIVRGGTPTVGDPVLHGVFAAQRVSTRRVDVDGVPRLMEAGLAGRLERCAIAEPGVECADGW